MIEKLFFGREGTFENRVGYVLILGLLMLLAVGLTARPAQAQSNIFVIDSLGDAHDSNTSDGQCQTSGGACTLRAAIQQSNADAPNGPDDIDFGIPGQVNLTGALPSITNSVNITGTTSRNTVFRGEGTGNYRIFTVTGGSTADIQDLTLSNGFVSDSTGDINKDCGGAILVAGGGDTLKLTNSTISGNSANRGGGIYAGGGTVSVGGSTFRNNSASGTGGIDGGGAIIDLFAVVSVTNSTFVGNSATNGGGAILNGFGSMNVANATLVGNSAGSPGGGGILSDSENAFLKTPSSPGTPRRTAARIWAENPLSARATK